MPPFLRFLIRRSVAILVTLVVVTAALYGLITLAPVETRASLYLPRGGFRQGLSPRIAQTIMNRIIREHGLNDPFPVQYVRWASRLLQGEWGWSPSLRVDVIDALITRTPMTAELTLYSLLLLVPLGLISGALSAARRERLADNRFRAAAFVATSIPPFILAFVLLAIFYVGLRWFPPERLSSSTAILVRSDAFNTYTGLITIDGLLNGRLDVTADAFRHLALPVITLSLAHWATLGRVTRALMIEQLDREYVTAARARGIREWRILWRHALRNVLAPALTSTALSAASLITGVYIVEVVFGLPGISQLITGSFVFVPDAPIAMGFAVYTILIVLAILFILDVLQAIADPRIRLAV